MRKIIAFVLAIACVLALASCGGSNPDSLDTYTAAIEASTPIKTIIETEHTNTALKVTLKGEYTIEYAEDGTATVDYKYEELNEALEADEFIKVVEGEVNIDKDGQASGDVSTGVTKAAAIKLTLDEDKMEYTIERGILSATVKAVNTKAVLGVEIASDVKLTMTVSDSGKIGTVSIIYNTEDGTDKVTCMYEYAAEAETPEEE